MPNLSLAFSEAQIVELAAQYPPRYAAQDRMVNSAGSAGKSRGHLTRDEFLIIAEWKSPRPRRTYEQNAEADVKEATARALAAGHDLERILALTALKGVRVRTVTAILHFAHAQPCPLIGVWAMTALGVPRRVTATWDELDWLRAYPPYAHFRRELAARTGHAPRLIDQALWVYGEQTGSLKRRKSK